MARGKRARSARPGTPEAREPREQTVAVISEQDLDEVEKSYGGAEIVAETDSTAIIIAESDGPEGTDRDVVSEEPESPPTRQNVTQRCENGKEDSCSCRCRGKYHAKPHPEGWKDEAGCEPLTPEERKVAHREALRVWRRAHPDRVKAYMKQWFEKSEAPTAAAARISKAKRSGTTDPVGDVTGATQLEAESVDSQ